MNGISSCFSWASRIMMYVRVRGCGMGARCGMAGGGCLFVLCCLLSVLLFPFVFVLVSFAFLLFCCIYLLFGSYAFHSVCGFPLRSYLFSFPNHRFDPNSFE